MTMQTQTAGGEGLSLPETEAGKSPGFSFGQSARQRFQSVPITPELDADLTELERACAGIYLYAARQKEPDETKGWSLEQQSREIPRLAEELGVTPELIRLSPKAAADQAWCNRLAQLDKTPVTNRWLTEGDNAVYATKSFHSLGKIEEEAISYRHGMRSLHGSLSDFQFLLSVQGKEGKESETRDEYAYFRLGYGEKIKRLMREAEASGLEKEEVFALLAKETPNLLNGSFKPTPLSEEEKARARRRYSNPMYRDIALRKALRSSNAPADVAASLAHDLARTEDWTPLLDEHLEQQSRSLFDKMTNTRTVLAETEEERAQYIEENGLFSPFVAFGEEVSYRWNEQKAGGQKISLVKQAQELAVAQGGLRVEKLLEGAQARGLDPWSVATKVLLDGPRSLENLSDAQVAEAQSRGIELRELLKTARYSEAARQDLVDRYGLTIDPSVPDDPQALLETMLRQGFVKDDLLSGIDSNTQQRRLYPDALLQQIAQRNAAIMQVGFSHEAWLHLPNGRAQRIEGRATEDVAQMKAALTTAVSSHEETNADLKERSKQRHPVQRALDEHPEMRGELIWNNPMTWLDGGLAKLLAGLPNAVLDTALVGGMSYAQTYTGEMLKGTENSSAQALQNHLLNPLSLMKAYDEASRKGFVSGTISAASMFLGANLVVKALGGAYMAGRVVMGAGGSAGIGGAAMALEQLNTEGKVDWTEIAQVIPSLLLLGLLGTGKARTPQELAQTLKTTIPEIEQQAAKAWVEQQLHKDVRAAREAGTPADRIRDYLVKLEDGKQEIVHFPSEILRSFLDDLAAREPDSVNVPVLSELRQRLSGEENSTASIAVPLADILPYLSDFPDQVRLETVADPALRTRNEGGEATAGLSMEARPSKGIIEIGNPLDIPFDQRAAQPPKQLHYPGEYVGDATSLPIEKRLWDGLPPNTHLQTQLPADGVGRRWSLPPSLEMAGSDVAHKGWLTGREHMIILDKEGRALEKIVGDEGRVQTSDTIKKRFQQPDSQLSAVHSHPDGSPLSNTDIENLLRFPGFSEVGAFGHYGQVSVVRSKPHIDRVRAVVELERLDQHLDITAGKDVEFVRDWLLALELERRGYVDYLIRPGENLVRIWMENKPVIRRLRQELQKIQEEN